MAKRPPRTGMSRKAGRWDDPDSESGGDEELSPEEKLEREHTQWHHQDGGDDDDEDDDLKGSDSDDGAKPDVVPDDFLRRRSHKPPDEKTKAPDEGLWDPLAGLGPRKKRKVHPGAGGSTVSRSGDLLEGTAVAGPKEGTTVCLHGLLKAPQLNGQSGVVEGPVDGATGRCPVLLTDGTVKSLKPANLREALTGAVVRLKGLQAAAELNGRIGECGKLDLASGRYDVILADEANGAPPKRVKEANIEFMRRFVTPLRMLSVQRRPFSWKDAIERARERDRRAWSSQLALLKEYHLPAPRLVPGEALVAFAKACSSSSASEAARKALASAVILAEKAPVNEEGLLACRLLVVSTERDSCFSVNAQSSDADLKRLGDACNVLTARVTGEPLYFLIPRLCVKWLPCLREAGSCAWPLYLHLGQALLCMESEYLSAKAWCRFDQLAVGQAFAKPVYVLPRKGCSACPAKCKATSGAESDASTGWLLSDVAEQVAVGAPSDGQLLPNERLLAERMASEVLTGGWRGKGSLTCYRL